MAVLTTDELHGLSGKAGDHGSDAGVGVHTPHVHTDESGMSQDPGEPDCAGHEPKETLVKSMGLIGSVDDIEDGMDVYGSCGNFLGNVLRKAADRLIVADSPDGPRHSIPLAWVAKVHGHIHLTKNCSDTQREWEPA